MASVVLTISSHVARGHVGNAAALFALQRLGIETWAVPTVAWNHHPGHGRPAGVVLAPGELSAMLARFGAGRWGRAIALVASGYCPTRGHVECVRDFIVAARKNGLAFPYCCDPIVGDAGGAYLPDDVIAGVRDLLVPLAQIVTPNRFELAALSGLPVSSNDEILLAARALAVERTLVTSAFGSAPGTIGNLLLTPAGAWLVETPERPDPPHGTGDLMAALFLAHRLNGEPDVDAAAKAAAAVHDVLAETAALARDELALVPAQELLVGPRTLASVTRLQ